MCLRRKIKLDWLNGDVKELRVRYEQLFHVDSVDLCSWASIEHNGQPLKWLIHHPKQLLSHDCYIVYFHGGGWIVGSPHTHADITQALSEQTGLRVVSIDYRLAPEYLAPAPIEDGMAVLAHLFSKSSADGGCKTVILGGDSAGAAIALAVERVATPSVRKRILGVCSLYGCFGVLDSASLHQDGSREDGLDVHCVRRFWTLANVPGRISPYAIESLGGLSDIPNYILAAGRDPMRDDSFVLIESLRNAGRTLALDVVESETHGFLHGARCSEVAQSAFTRIGAWVDGLVIGVRK
jgi:acetyl esterase/lipase